MSTYEGFRLLHMIIYNIRNKIVLRYGAIHKMVQDSTGVVPEYQVSVTGNYKNDAMVRQIMESIRINNSSNEHLMNSKNEWHNFQLWMEK